MVSCSQVKSQAKAKAKAKAKGKNAKACIIAHVLSDVSASCLACVRRRGHRGRRSRSLCWWVRSSFVIKWQIGPVRFARLNGSGSDAGESIARMGIVVGGWVGTGRRCRCCVKAYDV